MASRVCVAYVINKHFVLIFLQGLDNVLCYNEKNLSHDEKLEKALISKENIMDNQFFKTLEETEVWLNEMAIENYTIHEDLRVCVNGSVDINEKNLEYIPVQFIEVKGDFDCGYNELKSLKGCPQEVQGNFCANSNKLENLEYSPQKGVKDFNCSDNLLKSLKGCPEELQGSFSAHRNQLKNLEYSPQKGVKDFNCSHNLLKSLKGGPEKINGWFYCGKNQLENLDYLPRQSFQLLECTGNPLAEITTDERPIMAETILITPFSAIEIFNIEVYRIEPNELKIPGKEFNAWLLSMKMYEKLEKKIESGRQKKL